jgi:spoIIIJ-associated protein
MAERGVVEPPSVAVDEQAEIVQGFLMGLLEAFGLEGEVTTRVDGDIIYANVAGDQTEALVGPKGAILDAVLELCRTMVHRQSQAGARLRLDIAGYGERRREGLRIYAGRLAAKVLEEGGEVMLEPMNAADRKVVHDAVAEIAGVRSFSEGEDPERSVVIARAEEGS